MGEIGEAFEDVEQLLFPGARRIFTLPARHCELNGPNLVSLSPLSGAGAVEAAECAHEVERLALA
jgi:hypothetical protein